MSENASRGLRTIFLLPDWFVSFGENQGSGLFPVHKIRILTLGGRKENTSPARSLACGSPVSVEQVYYDEGISGCGVASEGGRAQS